MKKPNKATDMVVIFPLKKGMEREDYERMCDKICELFPSSSVVWYAIPEKQMNNIQKMLEKKFGFGLSKKEINILMERFSSKKRKNLKKKREQ
jgi:tRNA C32,U32 (ribose-2'-O)-methylase TrmJ